MNADQTVATTTDRASAPSTQAPELETPLADDIGEELEGVKLQLGYLARNMAGAFDGALSPIEANAHCALVTALGHLTTLEELAGHVRRKEREGWPRAETPARRRSVRAAGGDEAAERLTRAAKTVPCWAQWIGDDLDGLEAQIAAIEGQTAGHEPELRARGKIDAHLSSIRRALADMRTAAEHGEEAAE